MGGPRAGHALLAVALLLAAAGGQARAETTPPPPPPPGAGSTPPPPAAAPVPLASRYASDQGGEPSGSRFRDPQDGAFDMSRWLATRTGFLPLATPITEPAVGFGLTVGALFFHPQSGTAGAVPGSKAPPPSATVVAGGATSDGSWAGGVAHLGIWKQDRLRYVGGIGYGAVNLDFYGLGGAFSGRPRDFTTEGLFLLQSLSFRLGRTDLFVGGRYRFLSVETEFGDGARGIGVDSEIGDSRTGGFALTAGYDSRDNIFTPNRGLKAEASAWTYGEWLGGESTYEKLEAYVFAYLPVHRRVVLGLRLEEQSSWDDVPFYDLPYVALRGVPTFRYTGKHVATAEAEVRWDVTDRWSAVAFAGAGATATQIEDLGGRLVRLDEVDFRQDVVAGGVGFRYLIARALGLRVGFDVATSDDEASLYLTVGSAWLRP